MPFKIGDLVRLRSGGPKMTVVEQSGDDVTCEWFVKEQVQRRTFKEGTLISMGKGGIVAVRR
jgi:uncharacterized protein YodC (DUF2158 family)